MEKFSLLKVSYKNLLKVFVLGICVFGTNSKSSAQVSLSASSGTSTGSYSTISDAFAAINAGTHKGTIAISITGNTTEPSSVTPLYGSGTASASSSSYTRVTIKPSGGNWTINSAATPSSNRGVIELAGADNVTIDGDDPTTTGTRNLTVLIPTTTTSNTVCVRFSSNSTSGADGATNDTLRNCILTGGRSSSTSTTVGHGVNMSNYSTSSITTGAYASVNNSFENNLITRSYHGIYANGASTTYPNTGLNVSNNFIGSSTASNNVGQYGIYLANTATSSTGSPKVVGNDISCGDYAVGAGTTIAGIYVSSSNFGLIIERNNIHDVAQSSTGGWGSHGISFISSTNNSNIIIRNNFIRDITAQSYSTGLTTSFQNYGIFVSVAISGMIINHNTIYLNKANATSLGTSNPVSACINIASATATIAQLYNNILINNQGSASSAAYCILTSGTGNISSASVDNNNYFVNGSGKIGYYSGSGYTTFSAWQSITGKDVSSINENTTFTSTTDPHIAAGTITLCESGGVSTTTTGVSVDIDNQSRPGSSTYGFGTAPDIGADEFDGQVVYSCATPAPGATLITPASALCFGSSVTLSLTTATTGTGVSYQWQTSPDNVAAYTDITGATSNTYSFTPTASSYYRCKVTCKNGPVSTNSTPVQVSFTNNISSTTNGVRCGTGTVNLSASGNSGTTLNWYTAASGGLAIGSGSPFTTPIISSSTNYYVASENNSSGSSTIGAGGTTSSGSGSSPFSQTWESNHSQYLVRASDLIAAGFGAGNFTALSMTVTTKSSSFSFSRYTIKMANTTATAMTGYLAPSFTTVYGPVSYSSVLGSNDFSFGTSFSWDGSSNVLVDICFDNDPTVSGTFWSSSDAVSATTMPYTAVWGMYSDDATLCGATSGGSTASTSSLPVFKLTGNKVCSSPRVLVTATVNTAPAFALNGNQTVCNNGVATINVASTLSSYNTYSWTPAAGLFTDASCTTAYTAGSSASTVYAKTSTAGTIRYLCTANNATSLCSAIDSAKITTLPSSISAVATPANLCGSGTTKLDISPSVSGFGTAQYQWQTSADNSSFSDSTGQTGSFLNTATVFKTRYYRVILKNGAGATCLNSTSDTALVFNPNITSSTGASRCGPGSVTLAATGADGTISWFAASSGGSSLGSGTSYTTPSLSSTTTYYAEVRSTADKDYTLGSGSTSIGSSSGETGLTPFSGYYEGQHTQYLILAADLVSSGLTAGKLSSLSFNVSSKLSSMAYTSYTLGLAQTSATNLSSGLISPSFTTVYGPASYTTASGDNKFTFPSPFTWDGTSNLVVDVCFSNDPTSSGLLYSSNDVVTGNTTSYVSTYGWYMDNSALCGTTGGSSASASKLPNITFGTVGCVSSRTAVVATINTIPTPTISPATGPIQICDGNTTTFTAGGGGTYQWKNAAGLISGATSGTYTTGVTGTYSVIVTTPATGCKDSSVFVAVNVNPSPTVSILPAGTRFICADSAQAYTSVVTGSGLTYQWFRNDTAITGANTNKYSSPTAGRYTMRVYLGTCSDTSNEAILKVNPLPPSSFIKTGPTDAICLGGSLELTALTIPLSSSYQWTLNGIDIPGAVGKIHNANVPGLYRVRIKDSNSCRKVSDSMDIINTPMGIPNLLPKDVRFCEGTEITLYSNAGPYAARYKWAKDGSSLPDTTSTIVTGNGGFYEVTVKDVYGCELTSPKVSITVDPLPIKPVIVQTGMDLKTVDPYSTYQWYRNGKSIAGANKRNYTLAFDGNYYVIVSNSVNCINTSDVYSVKNLSVSQVSKNDIEVLVYPNPSQNIVNIDAVIPVDLVVRDLQGRQIEAVKNATQIDMTNYADGMYIFTISDKNGAVIKMDKIIKRSN